MSRHGRSLIIFKQALPCSMRNLIFADTHTEAVPPRESSVPGNVAKSLIHSNWPVFPAKPKSWTLV